MIRHAHRRHNNVKVSKSAKNAESATVSTSVYMPIELLRRLEKHAEQNRRSVSGDAVYLIERALAREEDEAR